MPVSVRMSRAAVFLLLCVRAEFASVRSLNAPREEKVLHPDGTGTNIGTSTLRGKKRIKRKKVDQIPQKFLFEKPVKKQHMAGSMSHTHLQVTMGCGVTMGTNNSQQTENFKKKSRTQIHPLIVPVISLEVQVCAFTFSSFRKQL